MRGRGLSLALTVLFVGMLAGWLGYSEVALPGWIAAAWPDDPGPGARWFFNFVEPFELGSREAYLGNWYALGRRLTLGMLIFGLGVGVLIHRPRGAGPAEREPEREAEPRAGRGRASSGGGDSGRAFSGRAWVGALLLVWVLTSLTVIGRRSDFWPLLTAAVYSAIEPAAHPAVKEEVDLHMVDAAGGHHVLEPHEFWGQGRAYEARYLLEQVADSPSAKMEAKYRRYLNGLAGHAVPGARIVRFEVWRTEWDTEPHALPPFDFEHPDRHFKMGELDAAGPVAAPGGPNAGARP